MSEGAADASFVLETGPPGTRFTEVRRFTEVDSTNRYLIDEASRSPRDGVVAVAEHQTAGRGRLGRRWEAPPGTNLLVSILITPTLGVDQLHLCTVAVALAAVSACRQAAGVVPTLKWPNDLLVGEQKLAGILAESMPMPGSSPTAATAGDRGVQQWIVVVGLGLNIGWPPPDDADGPPVPAELQHMATSIWRCSGARPDPQRVLELLLVDLEERLRALDHPAGRQELAQEYRSRCATLGRTVRVELDGDETRGTAVDITPEGHLVVDVGACFTTVMAGDVVHVHTGG
jgi:BirA family biotin operon repressor/biotin-[acetyl-CoA-carboxylase] ligase